MTWRDLIIEIMKNVPDVQLDKKVEVLTYNNNKEYEIISLLEVKMGHYGLMIHEMK